MRYYARLRLFRPGEARPQTEVMVPFIDQYRDQYGVEAICKALPITPSTYHHHKALKRTPERRRARAKRDALVPKIRRARVENHRNYGACKVWQQLKRESFPVTRYLQQNSIKRMLYWSFDCSF